MEATIANSIEAGESVVVGVIGYFGQRLVDMAGNRKLTAIYRKLTKELSLFRRMNLAHLADGGQLPVSAGEHRAIVKAIASGDAQAAGQAMFDHVMESKARMVSQQAGKH
jgi:DNA-binding GntR family transcriptional regulator